MSLAGCMAGLRGGFGPASGHLHYVVGQPYQIGDAWYYPRAQFDYDDTGLAARSTRLAGFTEDGEVADAQALAGGHRTLQLPALAKITNLDTGLQVVVRLNDRGPAQRGRLVALTPRVFELLGAGSQASFRVRVQVQEGESRLLAAQLANADPALADQPAPKVAAAPAGAVHAESLAPPPGVQQSPLGQSAPMAAQAAAAGPGGAAAVPLRLPEQLYQIPPRPGGLYVETGAFGELQYAEIMRARLASLGAQTSTSYEAPRDRAYRVRIGPLSSVPVADAMLERAVRMGVSDARIVAE